jgi:hypothetical protein
MYKQHDCHHTTLSFVVTVGGWVVVGWYGNDLIDVGIDQT